MQIRFWGVRGTIPAPGAEFNRYGGNTACVAVHATSGALLILDAGTGIIPLGRALLGTELGRGTGQGRVLLTHGHWDHIQGFPFFAPAFIRGNRLTVHGYSNSSGMLEGILEGQMSSPFSPIRSLRNMGATIALEAVQEGVPLDLGGLTVTARSVPHGRGHALAYRLDEGPQSLVYAPDAAYDGAVPEEVRRLYRGASLLIHDCTYSPEDAGPRLARGHSSLAGAARVAAECGVGQLVMFHYDQDYTDDMLDALTRRCRQLLDEQPGGSDVGLVAAQEGMVLEGL